MGFAGSCKYTCNTSFLPIVCGSLSSSSILSIICIASGVSHLPGHLVSTGFPLSFLDIKIIWRRRSWVNCSSLCECSRCDFDTFAKRTSFRYISAGFLNSNTRFIKERSAYSTNNLRCKNTLFITLHCDAYLASFDTSIQPNSISTRNSSSRSRTFATLFLIPFVALLHL